MQQVVMNFLINAADAIGNVAGMITVRTRHRDITDAIIGDDAPRAEILPGRYVCLEVVDDGVGMTPETEKKIFDPFFTTKAAGRGLGLAAVMGIVKAHHGAIQVKTALGVGTTFRVFLPTVTQGFVTPATTASDESTSLRPEDHTVLVVDDDKVVRQLAEAILNVHGFRVLTAGNGAKALELLAANPQVSAVLLDLTMPVMTGEQAIPKIKELRRDVAIVLSSGYDEGEVALRFAGAALSGFLQKPYSSKVMIAAIEQAIRDQRARTAQ
jgi:CheY-like chemotaxis protein